MTPLKHFRWWCQSVLPLVYDDSLSYYEVLCKVTKYINELIDQDNEFGGEISNIEGELNKVIDWIDQYSDEPVTRKYLFIGDSYAASNYADWPHRVGSLLGLTENQDYWIVSASGSGFASGTWLQRLMLWAEDNGDKLDKITDIVCAGGINDAISNYYPNLWTQLTAFAQYAKNNFTKATVKIAYIGGCWYDSATYNDRPLYNRIGVIRQYSEVGKLGMKYLPGCESVMEQTDRFVGDRIHPNSNGADAIVSVLYDAITNGSAYVTGRGNVNIAPADDSAPVYNEVTAGTQYKQGDNVTFNCNISLDSISGLTLGNNEAYLGDIELPFTTQMSVTKVPCFIRVGSEYSEHMAVVRIVGGKMYIKVQEQNPQDATQWLTYTPNRLYISFTKSGNVHEF